MKLGKIVPTIPFTKEAYEENQREFDRLTTLQKEVIERLQAAREMGDLSENGAYHAAKFELGNVRRQLRYLKHKLVNGYIADAPKGESAHTVQFGKTVDLTSAGQNFSFTLVSEHESDLAQQKLSLDSPIGKAITGKKVGETVSVTTPRGDVEYTITKIY